MKKTLAAIGAVALIGGAVYLVNNTSTLPAPTIIVKFSYSNTDCLGWINLGVDKTTNLANWKTMYIWSNAMATNYTFIDGKSNEFAFYRAWVNWTNASAETNESMRPPSYRNL